MEPMPILRPPFALALAWFGIAGIGGCTGILNKSDVIHVQAAGGAFGDPQALTRHGVAALQRGDVDVAEANFKTAIRFDDSYGPAHNNLGRIYYQRRELKRAADAFHWAMEFMPGRPEPINNLGLVHESIDNFEKAIELYRAAHVIRPDNPEYLANLVRVRMRRGDQGGDIRAELQMLKFIENRPEWQAWVDEQLALTKEKEAPDRVRSAITFPSASDTISTSSPNFEPSSDILPSAIGPELASPTN